jgi:hypothetical protein
MKPLTGGKGHALLALICLVFKWFNLRVPSLNPIFLTSS